MYVMVCRDSHYCCDNTLLAVVANVSKVSSDECEKALRAVIAIVNKVVSDQ